MPDLDKPEDRATDEALADLRALLHDSYEAALRLKRDVPSEEFHRAYQLSQTIRELRKQVEKLRRQLSQDPALEFDYDLYRPDMLSSSESSASIC